MSIFGRRDIWAIEVDPLAGPPAEPDPAAAATWTAIRIWVEGRNLTAHTRTDSMVAVESLHWPAIYLARWFLHGWDGFWNRAGWPLPGLVQDARTACTRLDHRAADIDLDQDEEFLERRDEFVESHSLLAAAAGGVMPHLYLLHESDGIHVVWGELGQAVSNVRFHEQPGRACIDAGIFLDATVGFMQWCREAVAQRAPEVAAQIAAWLVSVNSPAAAEARLNGYIRPWGVPAGRSELLDIEESLELPSGWRSAGSRLDPGQYPAAVVFRALTPVVAESDVLRLLGRLRACPPNPEAAKRLAEFCIESADGSREAPHSQGYRLAEELRRKQGNTDRVFDVEAFFVDLGIAVEEEDLSDRSVDAATIWDHDHGPLVVINRSSPRELSWARRMTLAHELCHLLVDRSAAAALMIASSPWAPPELERRANAFAAELLLPRLGMLRVADREIRAGHVDAATREQIMTEFKVGATVCAHQLENRLRIFG